MSTKEQVKKLIISELFAHLWYWYTQFKFCSAVPCYCLQTLFSIEHLVICNICNILIVGGNMNYAKIRVCNCLYFGNQMFLRVIRMIYYINKSFVLLSEVHWYLLIAFNVTLSPICGKKTPLIFSDLSKNHLLETFDWKRA